LKANIAERCRLLNEKKAALDTKTDTSAHSQRLQLLEKELEDLKAKVRATEQRIQEEKNRKGFNLLNSSDMMTDPPSVVMVRGIPNL
jgi:predicted  nucleic acid-binding Zn-ribbon protein